MPHPSVFHHRAGAAVFVALVLLPFELAGCSNPSGPMKPVQSATPPPPVPATDVDAVRLFAWCWNNRAVPNYAGILTDDFRFQFAARDTSGYLGQGDWFTRAQELDDAHHLFESGTATLPPATSIELTLDGALIPNADSRVGKDPKWHREILTSVLLRIKTESQEFQVTGHARFFVVRGDSAAIPAELQPQVRPDSTRWWIERWEDETDEGAGAAPALASANH